METRAGILSIVFFVMILFQSCAVSVGDAITDSGESGGSAGIILAFLLLASGIVSIASKNNSRAGGDVAILILCALSCLFGFTMAGSYTDLLIWSGWCAICAIMAIISIVMKGSSKTRENSEQ